MSTVRSDSSETREEESPDTFRLTSNISAATKAALGRIMKREGISQTEALRRLVGYGALLYESAVVEGDDVLIRRRQDDTLERIVLV